MNGYQALAYARIRNAAGESDFTRAARQQEVIAALRDRLVKGAFLDNPGAFLKSLGPDDLDQRQALVHRGLHRRRRTVERKDVFRVVINHPLVKGTYDKRGSIQVPDLKAIRSLAPRCSPRPGRDPMGFDTMPSAGTGSTKRASSSTSCGIKADAEADGQAHAQADALGHDEAVRPQRPPHATPNRPPRPRPNRRPADPRPNRRRRRRPPDPEPAPEPALRVSRRPVDRLAAR